MTIMHKLSMLAAGAALAFATTAGAQSLIYTGQIGTENGGGLGNQITLLTLQSPANSTTATGCVEPTGINPSCAITYPDARVQQQSFEQWIAGLTGENLRIVFNAAEPGNDANDVLLDAMTLYVYGGPTGSRTLLGSYSLVNAVNLSETYNGVGTFGFAFQLDATGAASFNNVIDGQTNLTVGLGARVLNATGGLETFSLAIGEGGGPNEVPEPASALLVLSGLAGLGVTARRRVKR